MTGTKEGGQKAAETRKEHSPEAYKMGQKTGQSSHGGGDGSSERTKKTKKEHDPKASFKMGQKGGRLSRGSKYGYGRWREDENE